MIPLTLSVWGRRLVKLYKSESHHPFESFMTLLGFCGFVVVANVLSRQAKNLQNSLQALAERIEEVKTDHDRLESENRFLQDYIGSLTQTMSKSEITSTTAGKTKKNRK